MAGNKVVKILDVLSTIYQGGAYPGRNSEGLNPEWPCDPFHVLVATILSQRTKDDNTRKASDNLFHRYPTLEELAEADPDELSVLIRPAGFPNQKAKAIVGCCRIIRDQYGGEVPSETEEMVKLPMVGRKTAACVRSYAMCIPSVCVDTHVHRISNLMGLVDTKDPEATEFALMAITPEERWSDINRYLVRHGQEICLPNHPRCGKCPVSDMCRYNLEHQQETKRCAGSSSTTGP
ncbi:MAG: endonuclease III [Candidatus Methanomethylophilaceae archaeon]|nr:endonuclease III [Candidatus Methanomethylophilaceae archaeon]